ncbi:hypothetical protein E2C01_050562 [Portunus trituberculatus]|uniref:Uncharacterized protein n=1 Tax=Portunus trituberculatus TaxID=210409 RepID=A0A5B7GGH1_PORTR|nr:hypothetical protein [Portunus trituberculatus]
MEHPPPGHSPPAPRRITLHIHVHWHVLLNCLLILRSEFKIASASEVRYTNHKIEILTKRLVVSRDSLMAPAAANRVLRHPPRQGPKYSDMRGRPDSTAGRRFSALWAGASQYV